MRNLYTVNSSNTELEQVAYKHQTSCRSGWQRGFGELNPSPYSWIFSSISVGPSHLSYLFTSATARIPVHTARKWGTEPIRYMTLHFRDQQAQLRSVTEIIAPKISGGSRGGVQESGPPLIFRPNWGPKGRKKFFWRLSSPLSKGLDKRLPPPPISRSGSCTENHRSFVWTEALPGMVLVPQQMLTGIVWTYP